VKITSIDDLMDAIFDIDPLAQIDKDPDTGQVRALFNYVENPTTGDLEEVEMLDDDDYDLLDEENDNDEDAA
jgi:hypothetical protein